MNEPTDDASTAAEDVAPPDLPPAEPPVVPPSASPASRRLHRSRHDSWFGGVAGGLAEYLNIDPALVRIGFVVLGLVTSGIALLGYLIAWIVIPEAPKESEPTASHRTHRDGMTGALIGGLLLIAAGTFFLLQQLDLEIDWPDWQIVAASALILVGLVMAFQSRRGTQGGWLVLAILLTGLLSLGAVADFNPGVDGAFGERTVRVSSIEQLDDSYSHAFGSLFLDLRDLDVPEGQTARVDVSVAFGEAEIRLPAEIPARLEVSSLFGSIEGTNIDSDGIGVSREYEPPDWDTAPRRIEVHLSTAFGSGRIR